MSRNNKIIILIERLFYWDIKGYREGNYLPLETIDDLVEQFNYVGFNDLCIYPVWSDLATYMDPMSRDTKGIEFVYYGHTNKNQSGK